MLHPCMDLSWSRRPSGTKTGSTRCLQWQLDHSGRSASSSWCMTRLFTVLLPKQSRDCVLFLLLLSICSELGLSTQPPKRLCAQQSRVG